MKIIKKCETAEPALTRGITHIAPGVLFKSGSPAHLWLRTYFLRTQYGAVALEDGNVWDVGDFCNYHYTPLPNAVIVTNE